MKKLIGICLIVFVGVFGYRVAGALSSDAVGMAMGVFFGILAGIPAALLVIASNRRRQDDMSQEFNRPRQNNQAYPQFQQQLPVIILTGGQPSNMVIKISTCYKLHLL